MRMGVLLKGMNSPPVDSVGGHDSVSSTQAQRNTACREKKLLYRANKEQGPMAEERNGLSPRRVSSGPLRIYEQDGRLFVTGFGLWIPVQTEEEGQAVIRELEDQGFRICY